MTIIETPTDRNDFIRIVKHNLRERSGKSWSVKGGRGTAWGWVTICALPSQMDGYCMSEAQCEELGALLGERVHSQGTLVPSASDFRMEYVQRSAGVEVTVVGVPSWD